ncbi:hypothetical protein [Polyangium fumosum]|uniref:Uncharacterized protein n=1 Tax=Polyangium fumosum TaxID=889272 RepID=A0A4U1JGH0_9BACT|nr:hypothetical protein [Polyangium fumosum]TKD09718.1 hypothetical protein E8A74_11130 [Polyangium fumosum]
MSAEKRTAELLFARFFQPYYPKDVRFDLTKARTEDANPAGNATIVGQIEAIAETFAHLAPKALGAPDLVLDYSDASVHRLGAKLSREKRDAWLEPQAKGEPPFLVQFVTHGALYVGACVVKNHGGVWQVRRPLWESLVRLTSRAGTGDLSIFGWWLKALSDDEIDLPRLVDRYRTHVEVPTFDAEALPVIAPPDRRMPRLAKVRYDLLYKHLRAHLPELRDVGEDFPSAERFTELGFKWLDFVWLGGGRMLLLHGPTPEGVHLFWLDAKGFVKSAFYPADAFPAHVVETDGDKLRVIVSIQGQMQVHEMLWWGA